MKRGLIFGIVFILSTALFCSIINSDIVYAYWQADFELSINGYTAGGTIPANGDWNQIQAGLAQNNQPAIPSTVITNGIPVSFGVKHTESGGTAWGFMTYYIKNPTSYTPQNIQYNGSTYNIKYPCGFINYYPQNVTIPAGYTTCSDVNSTRSVRYPDTSYGSWGIIEAALIIPTGQEFLEITSYRQEVTVNPLSTNNFSYENYYWNNGNNYGMTILHTDDSNYNFGVNYYWVMDNSPIPIFCDFYDALEYSCSGHILDDSHVLAGLDSAVVTPTPTPTPTTVPQITGSVIIDGGSVSIDNFPTPTPTSSPWFPVIEDSDNNERPTDIPEDVDYEYVLNLYRQSQEYLGLPTDTPSPDELSEFWSSYNQYLWNSEDGFIPKNIISDFSNPDDEGSEDYPGSIFRYPRTAMENVEDSGFLKLVADTVSIFGDGSDDYVVQPGDNIMTYIMFGVVGIFVFWIFSKIMR